jgi:hypothetical protein
LAFLATMAACGVAADPLEGQLTDGRYHHAQLGWRFTLPQGWQVMSREDVARITGKGKDLIEKTIGTAVQELHFDLLYLKRGPVTSFTSTRQRFDPEYGTYAEQQDALFEVILSAYREAGIPVRTERGSEMIDGVEFQLTHVWMLSKDRKKEVAQQYAYDGLLGSEGLTVSITSGEAEDLKAGLAAWRASRFDRHEWSDVKPGTAVKH